ncbi:MAG TPA: SAM-dependent chlorinase/fluorinase [Chloroflexota bacterium]|nr:SAM-dependent chlorinase/fluorinase [Chloroflexota bacterium]
MSEARNLTPSTQHSALITLTTDFGLTDNFVGVMKGVIAGIAPAARVIDLSHVVPPQDVRAGAFVLATGFEVFPPGTIHLAIVDPGVGSARRAIALAAGGYRWVAPDNGLLGYALAALAAAGRLGGRWNDGWWVLDDSAQAVELAEPRYWRPAVSRTFHGRDVFAPVAAHLAAGVPLDALGPRLDRVQALALLRPEWGEGGWRGEVIYVDNFGNLLTSLTVRELGDADWQIVVEGPAGRGGGGRAAGGAATIAGLSASYAAMPRLGAILGSSGHLEIAVPNGSAAKRLGAGVGWVVRARPR